MHARILAPSAAELTILAYFSAVARPAGFERPRADARKPNNTGRLMS
jgi:hypothetical protein